MLCEYCDKDHDESFGSGRFCSIRCSSGFSTKFNRLEINKKVSLSLKRTPYVTICECIICQMKFSVPGRSRKICSEDCRLACRKKASILAAKTKTLNGTHSGWHTRKGEMSYPEKYFKSVFDFAKLSYVQELKVGKWFIDFIMVQ